MKLVINHFRKADPVMAKLVEAGFKAKAPIRLRQPVNPKDYFLELAESIVSQQLSVKAASTIWRRLEELLEGITPAQVLKHDINSLRRVGVSRQKAGYLHAIARSIDDGKIKLANLDELDDQAVIDELIKLKGVGVWTAEMFLMFTLGRPDVFSYGDLGLVRAFERTYGIEPATPEAMEPIVLKWKPYRTYGALALWHSRDNPPLPQATEAV